MLSGPNLAKEIAASQLTGTVIASSQESVRTTIQELLKSNTFRVYTNDDVFGIELGGSLKNIYAIIAGIASALGMGYNTNSMLITRSLTEMARFGRRWGLTHDLPGFGRGRRPGGDLFYPLSRNYRIGEALGKGKSLEEAVEEVGQVAEGVNTVRLVAQKAEEKAVYMPLATGLYKILYEQHSIESIISSLMLGDQALDVEFAAHSEKVLIEE